MKDQVLVSYLDKTAVYMCECGTSVYVYMYYVCTAGSAHLMLCDISLSLPSPTPHSPSSHRSLSTQHLLWEGVVL